MESAISIQGISKYYRIRSSDSGNYGTDLADDLLWMWKSLVKGKLPKREVKDFWALRSIDLEIKRGEVVGLIGRNGAGKSTLLKILARVVRPSSGHATLRGRVGSLLEVGTGFHPDLTGRENVYLAGAILGLKRFEIQNRFDEIVAFSEIEAFLDTPVKRYSSGMYTRLAFAVAAHLESEILLIDEVLAVGDAAFQAKCLGKMNDVAGQGRTVVFVSHSTAAIQNLCTRAVYLKNGQVIADGPVRDVMDVYLHQGVHRSEVEWPVESAPQAGDLKIRAVRVVSEGMDVLISKPILIEVEYDVDRDGLEAQVHVNLEDAAGTVVFSSSNDPFACGDPSGLGRKPHAPGRYLATMDVPPFFLNDISYSVSVYIGTTSQRTVVSARACIGFSIVDSGEMRGGFGGEWWGMVRPRMIWSTRKLGEGLGDR